LNGGDPEKDGGKAADIVDPVRANAAIAACQRDDGSAYFWDGNGPNPYFGLLAWADYILVTADSASMLSEAGTTGKPVYMVPMQGGSPRLDLLHENLQKAGVVQKFEGKLEKWDYTPLNDAQKVADFIREHLNRRRKQTI
ncbi:MAG TPA: hypothetical protein DEA50_11255, partial [Parvularcula sp.]|nr:hypothetical protein [Parvularcula sp.]